MNRPIATVLAVILSLICWWLAWYDFDSRGPAVALYFIVALIGKLASA